MPTLAEVIHAAQALAIERLVRIVQHATSDRDARLAAVALLNLKPAAASARPRPAAADPPTVTRPSPAPPSPASPLTADEIEALHRRLPHLRRERFLRKTPAYWRSLLRPRALAPASG